MGTLGDYIHSSWTGYANHGTKRFQRGTDFKLNIFQEHEKILKAKINADKKGLSKTELQRLENEYNHKQNKLHKEVANIVQNKNSDRTYKQILTSMIASFNGEWNDKMVAEIVKYIRWDESKQTLVYAPTSKKHFYQKKKSSSLPRIVKWKDAESGAKFHYVERLLDSIIELRKALLQLPYCDAFKNSTDEKRLDKDIEILTEVLKTLTIIQDADPTVLYEGVKYNLKEIRDEANRIRFNYGDIDTVNKIIQAQFAEFLGNMLDRTLISTVGNLTKKELTELFKDTFIGRGTSGVTNKPQYSIASLKFLEITAQIENPETSSIKSFFNVYEEKDDDGNVISLSYTFKSMGDPKAQKADVLYELTVGGRPSTVGISMKNISSTVGDIRGQDSSLMLYLLGASEICTSVDNIGTHYLNILSKHGKDGSGAPEDYASMPVSLSDLESLRKQGQRTLSLHILYSAFSGYGQLRNQQQGARILAIYDKDKMQPNTQNRVHFFSIPHIMETLWDTDQHKQVLRPAIEDMELFNNTYEKEYEDFPRRITQVLIDARKQNINAVISAALLKQVARNLT